MKILIHYDTHLSQVEAGKIEYKIKEALNELNVAVVAGATQVFMWKD